MPGVDEFRTTGSCMVHSPLSPSTIKLLADVAAVWYTAVATGATGHGTIDGDPSHVNRVLMTSFYGTSATAEERGT